MGCRSLRGSGGVASGSSADQGTLHLLPAPRTNHTTQYQEYTEHDVIKDKDVPSTSTDDVRMRVVTFAAK